ncbi:RNA polymerase sigma factor [Fimbriiglobus ruber]|uniref:High-affnity carbon uptake protein Hat/HatR n=1 Tax=Fimbriiglobus ruber TaxID=1908690 RepID=A0A225DW79_9BACT|nr:sigma factor-like helix-turn-helix DNA-binding protein [Fimbriiglobus ruber]OWK41896.1 High-affnity carbon uptake protein Hat/HatR [Fimbriiglobus ruber]
MSHSLVDFLRTASGPSPDRADVLWARYRETGDEAAFTTLVGWYGNGIYRRILIAAGFDHPLAEEVFQATLFKLHERRQTLACPTFEAALAWWRAAAGNEVRMALRGRRRGRARETEVARNPATAVAADAETEILRTELLAELGAAFNRLRPEYRETLALLYFENLPESRAAEILGRHRETVARWAACGLARLRDLLAARGVLPAAGGTAVAGVTLANAARAATPSTVRIVELAIAARVANPSGAALAAASWAKKIVAALATAVLAGGALVGWQVELMSNRFTPGAGGDLPGPLTNRPSPVLTNFTIVEVTGGYYEIAGDVTQNGVAAAGMTVSFGGTPETLHSMTTITDTNGHFDVLVELNDDGSDSGMATAQATDAYCQTSNIARDLITIWRWHDQTPSVTTTPAHVPTYRSGFRVSRAPIRKDNVPTNPDGPSGP